MSTNKVFINCPFDNPYFTLLKPLLFTLIYLDLEPQISETSDSCPARINSLKRLMKSSNYSIHDLSRMDTLKKGELPRFNMPFECGVDFGLKFSDERKFRSKRLLILEKERFRYQKAISDISGNDIKSHGNNPEGIVKAVRDWFSIIAKDVPWYKEIWLAYNEFYFDYHSILTSKGYNPNDIESFTFSDVIKFMKTWIREFKNNNYA